MRLLPLLAALAALAAPVHAQFPRGDGAATAPAGCAADADALIAAVTDGYPEKAAAIGADTLAVRTARLRAGVATTISDAHRAAIGGLLDSLEAAPGLGSLRP